MLSHQRKSVSKRDRGKRSLRDALGPSHKLADYLRDRGKGSLRGALGPSHGLTDYPMLVQPALYCSETVKFFLLLLASVLNLCHFDLEF